MIKKIINWMNWNLGGLRDPECFFIPSDEVGGHIALAGFDEDPA